jgi:hypothetical protein
MPLTNSGPVHRRGYSPLTEQDEEPSPPLDPEDDSQGPETETSEVVQNEAWSTLTWSFLASGVLTVLTSTHP